MRLVLMVQSDPYLTQLMRLRELIIEYWVVLCIETCEWCNIMITMEEIVHQVLLAIAIVQYIACVTGPLVGSVKLWTIYHSGTILNTN